MGAIVFSILLVTSITVPVTAVGGHVDTTGPSGGDHECGSTASQPGPPDDPRNESEQRPSANGSADVPGQPNGQGEPNEHADARKNGTENGHGDDEGNRGGRDDATDADDGRGETENGDDDRAPDEGRDGTASDGSEPADDQPVETERGTTNGNGNAGDDDARNRANGNGTDVTGGAPANGGGPGNQARTTGSSFSFGLVSDNSAGTDAFGDDDNESDRGARNGPDDAGNAKKPDHAGHNGNDGPPGQDTPADSTDDSSPDVARGPASPVRTCLQTLDGDQSALEYQVAAWQLLDEGPSASPGNASLSAGQRAALRATLNDSFDSFVGPNRLGDVGVFAANAEVAPATGQRRPNVTAHLILASDRLATTATADAERVFDRLQARNGSFEADQVRRHLRKATRALQQAEHVRARSPNPVAAVTHYRRAWQHAQAALDVMDAETVPQVTITRRADPVRNGSANYTVAGEVFDVRAQQLQAVELRVGTETTTVPVRAKNATPGHAVRFATRIELPGPVTNVTVVATDTGEPVSNLTDGFDPNVGADRLQLDGDGLPDVYERTVSTTDPADPDSDAEATGVDEAGDGVVDGHEDFDDDFLSTLHERDLGTDPLDNDTDGDDLRDGFEVRLLESNPLSIDTDEDGTSDSAEDADGDGLTNSGEQQANTFPTLADSDADGLNDDAELEVGTDPLNPDTDADNLTDGSELEPPFETDPLDTDSDDDGLPDGNETYVTQTANESVGATVSITGRGNVAESVSIVNGTRGPFDEDNGLVSTARVSPLVKIEATEEFERAQLTLSYERERVENASNLRIFWFDPDRQTFVPLNTTVNEQNATVTTRTDHFSRFMVMELSTWQSLFRTTQPPSKWSVEEHVINDLDGWTTEGNVSADGTLVVESSADGGDDTGDDGDEGSGNEDCDVEEDLNADCDGDGISNGQETKLGTDPENADTDGDGLDDGTELERGTDPTDVDTDDDGFGDQLEVTAGTDPTSPESHPDFGTFSSNFTSGTLVEEATATGGQSTSRATRMIQLDSQDGLANTPENVRIEVSVRTTTEGDDATTQLRVDGTTIDLSEASDETFQTEQVHLSPDDSDLRIEFVTSGDARVEVASLKIAIDTDGDGAWDAWETRSELPTNTGFGRVEIDPLDPDSDDDGLKDGEELGERISEPGAHQHYLTVHTLPDDPDHDDDGLEDGTEVDGWTIDVVNETCSEAPCRYNFDGNHHYSAEMNVSSDPTVQDTDGDGVTDDIEKRRLHTDPRAEQTYHVTTEHEAFLRNLQEYASRPSARAQISASLVEIGILESRAELSELREVDLNDASDDFDFVLGNGRSVEEKLLYKTPDGKFRTDTWFSNIEEVNHFAKPWIADMDSDGLTDAQELERLTVANGPGLVNIESERIGTHERIADFDEDDALDGGGHMFIGMHELGRSVSSADPYMERGEMWSLPTDPTRADVVTIWAVYDEEWRIFYDNPEQRIQGIIKTSEKKFNENFDGDPSTNFYFNVVSIDEYKSDEANWEGTEQAHWRDAWEKVGWPRVDKNADVISVFTFQPVGDPPHKPENLDITKGINADREWFSKFADARAKVNVDKYTTLIGGNDPTRELGEKKVLGHFVSEELTHLYMHELGHVFGAKHPGDAPEIEDGTEGIMCKHTCASPLRTGNIFTVYEISDTNKKYVRNNLSKVATASQKHN